MPAFLGLTVVFRYEDKPGETEAEMGALLARKVGQAADDLAGGRRSL